MFPKGKLLALLAVFAAIALITASGAFTTVQADRDATVNVAGDSASLLQVVPSNASSFAVNQSGGEVAIDLSSSSTTSEGATGVNPNSTTLEDSTLNITNQGEDTIYVNISATMNGSSPTAANATFYIDNSSGQLENTASGPDSPTLNQYINDIEETQPAAPSDLTNRYVINTTENAVQLESGESVSVGIYIETHGVSNESANLFAGDDAITVVAQDSTTTSNTEAHS